MPRSPLSRLLTGLGLALVGLGLAEVGASALPDPPVRGPSGAIGDPFMVPDPDRLWRMAPGDWSQAGVPFTVGADGLRELPWPAPDPAAPLVLAVGDSTVFGHGVASADVWLVATARRLAAAGVAVRVKDAAVPGYSTEQTRRWLDAEGWATGPSLLVIGNLWSDANLDVVTDTALLAAVGGVGPGWWLERSALGRWTRHAVLTAAGRPTARRVDWPAPGATGTPRVPATDYLHNLEAMMDGARARGVGVLVLALANPEEIRRPSGAADWDAHRALQAAVARARGVPRVDVAPLFDDEDPARWFIDSVHPGAEGHRRIGEAVADALLAAGWPAARLLPGPDRADPTLPPVPAPRRLPQASTPLGRAADRLGLERATE